MKIPSEAELIEMENRAASAVEYCFGLAESERRLDQEDCLDALNSLTIIQGDLETLIALVRAGVLNAR